MMSIVVAVNADGASANVISFLLALVLIYLLGRMRHGADIVDMPMIPAYGEILGCADRTDSARPSLSGTHFGQQRQCGAKVLPSNPTCEAADMSTLSFSFKQSSQNLR